jgi:hypothetical protein
MLMVQRKCGQWIHVFHKKSGEQISLQIKEVNRVGEELQVTVAIRDERRKYRVPLAKGDRHEPPLKRRSPPAE